MSVFFFFFSRLILERAPKILQFCTDEGVVDPSHGRVRQEISGDATATTAGDLAPSAPHF